MAAPASHGLLLCLLGLELLYQLLLVQFVYHLGTHVEFGDPLALNAQEFTEFCWLLEDSRNHPRLIVRLRE